MDNKFDCFYYYYYYYYYCYYYYYYYYHHYNVLLSWRLSAQLVDYGILCIPSPPLQ